MKRFLSNLRASLLNFIETASYAAIFMIVFAADKESNFISKFRKKEQVKEPERNKFNIM